LIFDGSEKVRAQVNSKKRGENFPFLSIERGVERPVANAGITEQRPALCAASGQAFYNTSPFTLRDLKSRGNQQQLKSDFEAYLDGFSPNVNDILNNFEFRNILPRLSKADALGTLIAKFLDPEINLSPNPVLNGDKTIRYPTAHHEAKPRVLRFSTDRRLRRPLHFSTDVHKCAISAMCARGGRAWHSNLA